MARAWMARGPRGHHNPPEVEATTKAEGPQQQGRGTRQNGPSHKAATTHNVVAL